MLFDRTLDPMKLAEMLWPDVHFYKQQQEIIYSVVENDETFVPAGNMLGKDFVAGFIALWFFLSRHPCRVVTTSADHSQLEAVLWGEVRRFIQTSKYPLENTSGGPLVVNHLHLRKVVDGQMCGLSYMIGRVAAKGEGMLGHHIADVGDGIPRTLFVADEASGVEDIAYERADTWAKRKLVIGNPFPCFNFFKRGIKGNPDGSDPGGDRPRKDQPGYYRKVIRITAEDSPNVRYARAEERAGQKPSGKVIIPGVLPYDDMLKRRETWDKVLQCVGLDADFYEGAEVLLYPPEWLSASERLADLLMGKPRTAEAIGVDPGEGEANTSMVVIDKTGVIDLLSKQTPDTSVIIPDLIMLGTKYKVPPYRWGLDRGGGGKQIADQLRRMGYRGVRTIAFGESVTPQLKRGMTTLEEKVEAVEEKYAYFNRRAAMYGRLRYLLDPSSNPNGFAIPRWFTALRRQLAPIPLIRDEEGRLKLPPKNVRNPLSKNGVKTLTMIDLIGSSPDEADSLVVALEVLFNKPTRPRAGS